ncbi:hypothetical protein BV20DRAFT_943775 [Pilatotrama ljubarskyi]|nr:hypothetical protein BV20DRAFT_943775 [Pilatotrama ljubarskyi]
MAAVASSSRPAGPRPSHRQRKTDVFKPRFPLDPFAGASAIPLGEPWFVKVDALLAATSYQRRNVIFILGGASYFSTPSLKELAPLLQSRHLAKSLVILATHNPPEIPHIVLPTVRILHLSAPLALEDAGAVRFVNVLEWAERVARTWRKHGGTGVLELSEELDIDSELTPPSVLRFTGSQSTPTSPGSSSTHLSSESLPSSRPSSIFRPPSSSSGTSLFRSRHTSQSLPRPDPSQRPFDALINFLPDHVSDKALLKNSILVTTISRPFLVSNGPATPAASRSRTTSSSSSRFQRPQSIFNAFSRSSTSVYLPPTPPYHSGESLNLTSAPPPPAKALLIHLLPVTPAHAPAGSWRKLVESMESFLVSFAFQALSPGAANGGETLERARPYVMQASTFCEPVGCEPGVADWGDWTVADVVLSGVLDAEAVPSLSAMNAGVGTVGTGSLGASTGKGKNRASAMAKSKATARRAWIGAAADLVIMPSAEDASPALSPDAPLARGAGARPDSYFSHLPQRLPPRAFEGGRSTSAPLMSADWSPGAGRPHSHPQTSQSFSSALSRQISPSPSPSRGGMGGLPTPPHSEESDECASTPSEDPRSPGSSVSGSGSASGKSASTTAKSGKRHRWKFWRRLSHMPAAIKA